MISVEEFVERLCRLGADRGPRRFPRNRRDRQILMKSILIRMDSGRSYTEPEINELIQAWKREIAPAISSDHVTVRRFLVDYGHLERTPDGGAYRVGFPTPPIAFDLEIDELDLPATIAAYIEQARSRRHPPTREGE